MTCRSLASLAATALILAACKSEPPPAAPTPPPTEAADATAPAPAPDAEAAAPTSPPPEADTAPVAPAPDTAAPTPEGAGPRSITMDTVCVALSSDARFVGAGDLGGRVLAWDLGKRNRMLLQDATPAGGRIGLVAFARDTPLLVSGAFTNPDAPVRIWQMEPAGPQAKLGDAGLEARDLAVDDAGRLVAAALEGEDLVQRVVLWEVSSGEVRVDARLVGAAQARVALAGGGTRLVAGDDKGTLHVWDAAGDWKEALSRPVDGAGVRLDHLVLSGDGATLWAAGSAQIYRIDLGDLASPSLVAVKTLGAGDRDDQVAQLARLNDDRVVALTRPRAGGLRAYDGDTGELLATLETGCRCEGQAIAANGTLAACDCGSVSEIRFAPLTLAPHGKQEAPVKAPSDADAGGEEADAGGAPGAGADATAPTPEPDATPAPAAPDAQP